MKDEERYSHGDDECIDAIRAALTNEEFRGFCKGNVLKYVWREEYKGGDTDMRKARDYIDYAGTDNEPSPIYLVINLIYGPYKFSSDGGSVSELCTNVAYITLCKEDALAFSGNEGAKPNVISSSVYEIGADWIKCAYTGDDTFVDKF
jgi:hypothetical protein